MGNVAPRPPYIQVNNIMTINNNSTAMEVVKMLLTLLEVRTGERLSVTEAAAMEHAACEEWFNVQKICNHGLATTGK